MISDRTNFWGSPILRQTRLGRVKVVETLLDRKPDPSWRTGDIWSRGKSALYLFSTEPKKAIPQKRRLLERRPWVEKGKPDMQPWEWNQGRRCVGPEWLAHTPMISHADWGCGGQPREGTDNPRHPQTGQSRNGRQGRRRSAYMNVTHYKCACIYIAQIDICLRWVYMLHVHSYVCVCIALPTLFKDPSCQKVAQHGKMGAL